MNSPRGETAGHRRLLRVLTAHTGLAFKGSQQQSAQLAIEREMSRQGISSSAEYLARVESEPRLLDELVAEVTVGETYFFRNSGQFAAIRQQIVPQLRERLVAGENIRVWSAGCSTGEEAYSLAILFEQEGLAHRTRILGTDISLAAITKARQGIYSDWSLRGDGATMIAPYVEREPSGYRLRQRLRDRVQFAYLNLAKDEYPTPATSQADLLLCRNVLIYFDAHTIDRVAGHLFQCLSEGGWLVTGAGDPPLDESAPFKTVLTGSGVFYRRPRWADGMAASPSPLASPAEAQSATQPNLSTAPALDASHQPVNAAAAGEQLEIPAQQPAAQQAYQRVKSLAESEPAAAERLCRELLDEDPLSGELHYLHALLLLESGRLREAAAAAQRVIYLDRRLAHAHFTLGVIQERSGLVDAAIRSFRNAQDLSRHFPADRPIPWSDGDCYGGLLHAVTLKLRELTGGD